MAKSQSESDVGSARGTPSRVSADSFGKTDFSWSGAAAVGTEGRKGSICLSKLKSCHFRSVVGSDTVGSIRCRASVGSSPVPLSVTARMSFAGVVSTASAGISANRLWVDRINACISRLWAARSRAGK